MDRACARPSTTGRRNGPGLRMPFEPDLRIVVDGGRSRQQEQPARRLQAGSGLAQQPDTDASRLELCVDRQVGQIAAIGKVSHGP